MKKLLALFLVAVLTLSFVACGEETKRKRDDDDDEEEKTVEFVETSESAEEDVKPEPEAVEHTGIKIEGEIAVASNFADGLALVTLVGEDDKTYCINKEGYVVFEIDGCVASNYSDSGFSNGFALINGAIYDKTGKCTLPEDVGVTQFYDYALNDGYIIAEIITSTYASTKRELGVMNTDFEWTVAPSEEFHSLFANARGAIDEDVKNYCNGVIYLCDKEIYIDMLTGKETSVPSMAPPSDIWTGWQSGDHFYYAYNDANGEKLMLDLGEVPNIAQITAFKDGKAILKFYNPDSKKNYFTLINEKGEFAFEPIEFNVGIWGINTVAYSDGYIVVSDCATNVKCYNEVGEIVAEMAIDGGSFEISEGVIIMRKTLQNFSYKCYYYNPDFTPLF